MSLIALCVAEMRDLVNLNNTFALDTGMLFQYHVEGSVTLPETRGISQKVYTTTVIAARSVAEI